MHPAHRGAHRNDGEAANALGAVDQHALDIGGRRRPGHEYPVSGVEPRALAVGMVQVADDPGWIQQYDEMLRQKAQRVHLEFRFGQPQRAGLRDPENGPHDAYVDIAQLRGRRAPGRADRLPATSGVAEQTTLAFGKSFRIRASKSPSAGASATLPPMRTSAALKRLERRAGRGIEGRYPGQGLRRRLVLPDPRQDVVPAAHRLLRFFRYHCRKVDCGAAGTSRCRPQAFNRVYIMNRGRCSRLAPAVSTAAR